MSYVHEHLLARVFSTSMYSGTKFSSKPMLSSFEVILKFSIFNMNTKFSTVVCMHCMSVVCTWVTNTKINISTGYLSTGLYRKSQLKVWHRKIVSGMDLGVQHQPTNPSFLSFPGRTRAPRLAGEATGTASRILRLRTAGHDPWHHVLNLCSGGPTFSRHATLF